VLSLENGEILIKCLGRKDYLPTGESSSGGKTSHRNTPLRMNRGVNMIKV
jgi:hypothetical protein